MYLNYIFIQDKSPCFANIFYILAIVNGAVYDYPKSPNERVPFYGKMCAEYYFKAYGLVPPGNGGRVIMDQVGKIFSDEGGSYPFHLWMKKLHGLSMLSNLWLRARLQRVPLKLTTTIEAHSSTIKMDIRKESRFYESAIILQQLVQEAHQCLISIGPDRRSHGGQKDQRVARAIPGNRLGIYETLGFSLSCTFDSREHQRRYQILRWRPGFWRSAGTVRLIFSK